VGAGFGLNRAEPFRIGLRVYYQDTDAGGVVFHAQYLLFMERARTEYLNAAGFDLARFAADDGILFMVHELAVRYHRPARLNDLLSVSAEVVKMGHASFVFRQRVERGAELLVEADVTVALVDGARDRPVRIPEKLRRLLERDA
jgi:tol-pal system-associated acyl-CoA thioesterase